VWPWEAPYCSVADNDAAKEATPGTTELLRNHYNITTNRLPHYYRSSSLIIVGDYEGHLRLGPVDQTIRVKT